MSDLFWNWGFLVLTKCLYKGPFSSPAFQDHSKACFHLDAFVSIVSPGLFVPCQPGMTFGCLVSLFAPALLLSAGQGVEGEHCASCQVLSVL